MQLACPSTQAWSRMTRWVWLIFCLGFGGGVSMAWSVNRRHCSPPAEVRQVPYPALQLHPPTPTISWQLHTQVMSGEIKHALRFTGPNSRRAYEPPATHYAPHGDTVRGFMGARVMPADACCTMLMCWC